MGLPLTETAARRGRLTAVLLGAALGLAACGSSGAFDDPAEFVLAADAVCGDAASQTVDAYDATLPTAGVDRGVPYFVMLGEITATELDALEELKPPGDLEDGYGAYLGQRRDAEDVLGAATEALEADRREDFDAAIATIDVITADTNAIGAELGFGPCANALDTENAKAVSEAIDKTATSDDAVELCTDFATESFQTQFGGLEECIRAQAAAPRAASVEINELTGVDGVRARAFATLAGKSFGSGRDFRIDLAFEDGGWRVQVVQPLP